MLHIIEEVNNSVNAFIWGVPSMVCIIGVGLLLTIRTKGLQFRKSDTFSSILLARYSIRKRRKKVR